MKDLQKKLGHRFANLALLRQALTHRSYTNEIPSAEGDNQRLEFLGDAILGAAIAELLYKKHPEYTEGALSQLKAKLVCEQSLALRAQSIQLSAHIRMGQGEVASKGNERPSVLADAYEAVIAAIFLDGGYEKAMQFIATHFEEWLNKKQVDWLPKDAKSLLQERLQADGVGYAYQCLDEESDPLKPYFVVAVMIEQAIFTKGAGSSKKKAEQKAAAAALEKLKLQNNPC